MHLGTEFNNQVGSSMQVDRNPAWMSGPPENPTLSQLPGQPPLVPAQMGPGNQPSRPPSVIYLQLFQKFQIIRSFLCLSCNLLLLFSLIR